MSENKEKQAEDTQQQECIEYLRWFSGPVIAYLSVCLIPVVKRKQWLNDACNPEKADQSRDEEEHFPLSDFGTWKMAFGKYNAYDQENSEFQQLKNLKTWDIVNEFEFFQSWSIKFPWFCFKQLIPPKIVSRGIIFKRSKIVIGW